MKSLQNKGPENRMKENENIRNKKPIHAKPQFLPHRTNPYKSSISSTLPSISSFS